MGVPVWIGEKMLDVAITAISGAIAGWFGYSQAQRKERADHDKELLLEIRDKWLPEWLAKKMLDVHAYGDSFATTDFDVICACQKKLKDSAGHRFYDKRMDNLLDKLKGALDEYVNQIGLLTTPVDSVHSRVNIDIRDSDADKFNEMVAILNGAATNTWRAYCDLMANGRSSHVLPLEPRSFGEAISSSERK